jgi:site-specific DNA-methyltransferase (adenine-specific)
MTSGIEDAGFEIRDQILWIYGSGFPKSHNLKGEWHGWGTALKPSHEPIAVARKPLVGTVAANVEAWGTGALNIDGTQEKVVGYDLTPEGIITKLQLRTPGFEARARYGHY